MHAVVEARVGGRPGERLVGVRSSEQDRGARDGAGLESLLDRVIDAGRQAEVVGMDDEAGRSGDGRQIPVVPAERSEPDHQEVAEHPGRVLDELDGARLAVVPERHRDLDDPGASIDERPQELDVEREAVHRHVGEEGTDHLRPESLEPRLRVAVFQRQQATHQGGER